MRDKAASLSSASCLSKSATAKWKSGRFFIKTQLRNFPWAERGTRGESMLAPAPAPATTTIESYRTLRLHGRRAQTPPLIRREESRREGRNERDPWWEREVSMIKNKQRRQSRGRLKSQWEEEQRGLDKVKGIRVLFYFVFCNKEKKKALIRSWLRCCLLLCGYCCLFCKLID